MKIVHICLCGPVTDGWNYQENLLTRYHVKNGLKVSMIASKWIWNKNGKMEEYEKSNYVNDDGVKMIRLSLKKGDIRDKFKYYENLYETIREEKPDIIFLHGLQFRNVIDVIRYVKEYDCELYVDNHADTTNSATNFLSKKILHGIIWKHYAKKLIPVTKKFYGVLPSRVDFLVNIYGIPKNKCELLVMGADDELVSKYQKKELRKKFRAIHSIREADFLIVTGGKIDRYKSQTLLLMKAVKKIENKSIKLIVFGSVADELKEEFNYLIDNEQIIYIGWIDSENSYWAFSSADLVVFPGRHSVFWEQVCGQGIPMIVKDLQGAHHVDLDGNVRFLKQDSVDEIKKNIEEIIDDKDLYRRMKFVAETKGRKIFSYNEISKRCIGI